MLAVMKAIMKPEKVLREISIKECERFCIEGFIAKTPRKEGERFEGWKGKFLKLALYLQGEGRVSMLWKLSHRQREYP